MTQGTGGPWGVPNPGNPGNQGRQPQPTPASGRGRWRSRFRGHSSGGGFDWRWVYRLAGLGLIAVVIAKCGTRTPQNDVDQDPFTGYVAACDRDGNPDLPVDEAKFDREAYNKGDQLNTGRAKFAKVELMPAGMDREDQDVCTQPVYDDRGVLAGTVKITAGTCTARLRLNNPGVADDYMSQPLEGTAVIAHGPDGRSRKTRPLDPKVGNGMFGLRVDVSPKESLSDPGSSEIQIQNIRVKSLVNGRAVWYDLGVETLRWDNTTFANDGTRLQFLGKDGKVGPKASQLSGHGGVAASCELPDLQ